MTMLKSLLARPSQESLRKQAKKLARDIATGNAAGIARARAQLPKADLPLSQRDAQLVLAREYGFPGWQQWSSGKTTHLRLLNPYRARIAEAAAAQHSEGMPCERTPLSSTHSVHNRPAYHMTIC